MLLAVDTGCRFTAAGGFSTLNQVKIQNVGIRTADGLAQLLRHPGAGFRHLGGGNREFFQVHTIKTVAVFVQRLVAMLMHGVHDGAHYIEELGDIEGRAAHQLRPLFTIGFRYDSHDNKEVTESFFR